MIFQYKLAKLYLRDRFILYI